MASYRTPEWTARFEEYKTTFHAMTDEGLDRAALEMLVRKLLWESSGVDPEVGALMIELDQRCE